MSTITEQRRAFLTNPILAEQLMERWEAGDHKSIVDSGDPVGDAAEVLNGVLVGPYHMYESDDADKPLANAWIIELEAAINAAVLAEWNKHIVPAAIAAVIEKLASAPDHLRAFPGSEQLRADLEALADA